jgi:hypothetical protein
MEAIMRYTPGMALALGTALLFACLPARAQQDDNVDVHVGPALVCDTQAQVERFVALYDGNVERTIEAVNGEQAEPNACGLATIAYVPGPPVAMASNTTGTYQVVRLLVVGVLTENGMQAAQPTPLYSVAKAEGLDV